MEQSSGCSTETADDAAHLQATSEGLSVTPHLTCPRSEGTSTTARHCHGTVCDSGAGYKTADLLTYLLTLNKTTKLTEETSLLMYDLWRYS